MRFLRIIVALVFCLALYGGRAAENERRKVEGGSGQEKSLNVKEKDRESRRKEGAKQAEKEKDAKEKSPEEKREKELTLERLYPKKSFFGPGARSMAFSFDGKYAAYLYRPYKERRHGSDLWIYDVEKGKARRVTSVSGMAKYQKNTRKVRDDRIKKANAWLEKKRGETKNKEKAKKLKLTAAQKRGDWVTDEDAEINDDDENEKKEDDEKKKEGEDAKKKKAPTYGAISSIYWSETANELLFTSGGDLYRLEVEKKDRITRLTRTSDGERSIAWLPDGSGYTFVRGNSVVKVVFGNHRAEEINLGLPSGESLYRYKLSPDGKSLTFMARKEPPSGSDPKKFSIAKYRDRHMQTQQLSRTVLDDPVKPVEYIIYLCKINRPMFEETELVEVYRHKMTSPGDRVDRPNWSLDSKRAVFSIWEQANAQVKIMEATFPEKSEKKEKETDKSDGDSKKDSEEEKEKTKRDKGESKKKDGAEKENTRELRKKRQEERRKGNQDKVGDNKKKERRKKKDDSKKNEKDKDDKEKGADEKPKKESEESDKPKKHPAKELYKFMHTGGPNTPRMIDPVYMADNRRVVFMNELTGFRHVQILDPAYESLQPLTQGHYEVYPIGITKKRDLLFVSATKEHSSRLDVYRIALEDGAMTRLSPKLGRYSSAAVSPDGTKVLASYVRFGALRELVFIDAEAGKQTALTDSHPPVAHELTERSPEMFSYDNRHGQKIHGTIFKPDNWKKSDKRPLLIYLYGGPLGTKKQVEEGNYDSAGYFFGYYMAKKHGYVTCTIDPRGCSGYGAVFEKANFERVGKPQVEDLVDGVKHLVKNYGVDPKRVSLHGWSFGGFQTQMCMYTEPEVFAAGIAGAGPTEWENYNAWYTRQTIGKSRTGTPDLKKFSLLPLAKKLEGHLLLLHGVEDSNVLYQDTMRVYRELLKAKKETLVELFIDPTGGHGLGGDIKNLAKFRKYEQFLLRTVGEWKPPDGQEKSPGEEQSSGEEESSGE